MSPWTNPYSSVSAMAVSVSDAQAVTAFWRQAGPKAWYMSDPLFDAEIAIRFEPLVRACAETLKAGLAEAEADPEGALGLCILMDQFPRNIYRGLALSWAHDPLALGLARRAVEAGHDTVILDECRQFFHMPFMHAEESEAQAQSVSLSRKRNPGAEPVHALAHRAVIEKFGRFPARNAVLGRAMTEAETVWLKAGGYGAEVRALQGAD